MSCPSVPRLKPLLWTVCHNNNTGVLIGSFNKLLANCDKIQSHVHVKLFQNYFYSFYSFVLWKQDDRFFLNICTECNKAIRRVWHLPYSARICMLNPVNRRCHIFDQFNVRFMGNVIFSIN